MIFSSNPNSIKNVNVNDQLHKVHYFEILNAYARLLHSSVYIINYQKKTFEYISDNSLFLCGYTAQEAKEMGFKFYLQCISQPDLDFLSRMDILISEFFNKIPLEDRKHYTISCDFHLTCVEGKSILIHHKLTPLNWTDDGNIWEAMCVVSLSNRKNSGNVKIYKEGASLIHKYDLDNEFWIKCDRINLTNREKEILQFSNRGYNINEIAEASFISPDTVKYHRKKIFEKLDVDNITEAVAFATNNKLV